MKLNAKLKTKSNYRGLNEQWVEIIQFLGSIVYVKHYDQTLDTEVTFDVNLNEITEIRNKK